MQLLQFLFVGSVAGWIMGQIRRGRGYGVLGNLVVGALGSFIGWFLAGLFQVNASNVLAEIVMAVLGAVVFFLIVGLVNIKGKFKKRDKEEDQ